MRLGTDPLETHPPANETSPDHGGRASREPALSEVERVQPGEDARPPSSNGIERITYSAVQTALTSVYCSNTSCPISRPQPDCLYPPKGRAASKML